MDNLSCLSLSRCSLCCRDLLGLSLCLSRKLLRLFSNDFFLICKKEFIPLGALKHRLILVSLVSDLIECLTVSYLSRLGVSVSESLSLVSRVSLGNSCRLLVSRPVRIVANGVVCI